MTRVSFLVPFFNCVNNLSEKSWRKCIESIISQTYSDWCGVFINDCSTDNSEEILKSYKDARVKIINNEENLGMTKSLNVGLKCCDSEFIARHDSDDFSNLDRISKQVDFLDSKLKYGVVGSFCSVANPELEIYGNKTKPIEHSEIVKGFCKNNPMVHGSVLIRSEIFKNIGPYNEKFIVCQDYELWGRMLTYGIKMHNIPEFLYTRISFKECTSKKLSIYRKEMISKIRDKYCKKGNIFK